LQLGGLLEPPVSKDDLNQEYEMSNLFSKYFTMRKLTVATILIVAALPLVSAARPQMATLTIVNNSGREIRHVYLAHVDLDDWTGDKLNNSVISPGQSGTIGNFSWDQQQVKVIGEDQDGCFLTGVVASDNNPTWTTTGGTAVDCGSNNGGQANQQ
jgi:hypothetical protein